MAFHFSFKAIGTSWDIESPVALEKSEEEKLHRQIMDRIELFDKNYSRFRKDSLVTQISEKAGAHVLPDDALPMLSLYKELYDLSDGLVTPLIGQVISDAGYDVSYSLVPKERIPRAQKWDDVMEYNHPNLVIKKPVLLDFGAFGKGYLIDIVAEIIEKNGITDYTVDAGGDMIYKNSQNQKIKVGLENPENFKEAVGIAEVCNQSLCGSAGNRRSWGKFHHIINPETVESPRHILALWTSAKSVMLADAMATALFFVEPEKMQKYTFEYAILYADHTHRISTGFPGSFFTS